MRRFPLAAVALGTAVLALGAVGISEPALAQTPTGAPMPQTQPAAPARSNAILARKPTSEGFVVGDYLVDPTVYNAFSPGTTSVYASWGGRAALEFSTGPVPWIVEGTGRAYTYPHGGSATPVACPTPGEAACVTYPGGTQFYVPPMRETDFDVDGRLEIGVGNLVPAVPKGLARIGLGVAYRAETTSRFGPISPTVEGIGYGIEKLPDLDSPWSLYGSFFYYPNQRAAVMVNGTGYTLKYDGYKYEVGATVGVPRRMMANGAPEIGVLPFLDLGFLGDREFARFDAPSSIQHFSPYVGLGVSF